MVEDVVGVAADNHGTATGRLTCPAGCSAAFRQQTPEARFIVALNSRAETFAGIDYTEIYSHADLFVTPSADDTGTSSLRGPGRITNVAVQDVCPTSTPDHLLIGTVDPVAWALTIDALEHDGPADPRRLPANVCAQLLMPGVDAASAPAQLVAAAAYFAGSFAYPYVPAEPALRCYVTASCPSAPTVRPRCRSRRVITVHLDARLRRAVRATLDARRLRVRGRSGHRVVVVDLRGRDRGTATLRVAGRDRAGRVIRHVRRFVTCTRP
jgi:hypothetical protein